MIIKILPKSKVFGGVRYNTDKVDSGKGELVVARNFHALEGIDGLRPQDYVNYLETITAQSSRIRYPQFHAVLSCKGKTYGKDELTAIAENWLSEMGYADNPYLLVFHKDTANNHIHIVTTRVGRDGRKINDSFERLRAYEVLDRLMDIQRGTGLPNEVEKSLQYSFSTHAQWMMVLESMGYHIDRKADVYSIHRHGRIAARVAASEIDRIISGHRKDTERIRQLRAIISRYEKLYSAAPKPVHEQLPGGRKGKITAYTSPLLEFLREKFGIQAVFHFKEGKPPYGYTLIDHAKKQVFKGSDIRPLSEFRESAVTPTANENQDRQPLENAVTATIYDNPDRYTASDRPIATVVEIHDAEITADLPLHIPDLAMPQDIDDEAILGRNRRRKKKARTNTR